MKKLKFSTGRSGIVTGVAAAVIAASAVVAGVVLASDHQDTPEVELSPRSDINDVYAFPADSTSTDRIVLVMTTSSPIIPTAGAAAPTFDRALLYQFKIDNNNDSVEDFVIQVTFDDTTGGQAVIVRGPAPPASRMAPDGSPATPPLTGTASVQLRNVPVIRGLTGGSGFTGGTGNNIKVFAGLRDDPFFIDLEQFFKILPDRRPATGPLSQPLTQQATGFRNPGVDLLTQVKANTLAIVVELPESLLTAGGGAKLGAWGTISR